MNRCLKEKTLLLLHDGDGTSAQRTHLTECAICAARYQQLRRDLETLRQILGDEQLSNAVSHRLSSPRVRWLPAVGTLAMALLLVGVAVQLWTPSARLSPTGASDGESSTLMEELISNPVSLNEALAIELVTEGAGSYDLAARVLDAERPCEWYDLPVLGSSEPTLDELDLSAASRRAACIEINQDKDKRLPNQKLPKNIS
jgi:hypothetical protein